MCIFVGGDLTYFRFWEAKIEVNVIYPKEIVINEMDI